jgi:hypothetical protein
MWPYLTEAGEKKARAMLPDMLDKNKPTWMTTLKLNEYAPLTVMFCHLTCKTICLCASDEHSMHCIEPVELCKYCIFTKI